MHVLKKLIRFFYREPDFYIGGKEQPYMRRWWLIPRNRFFNIYLHNILRSDDDRALHDHPWRWCSILLRGAYFEITRLAEGKDFMIDTNGEFVDVLDQYSADEHTIQWVPDGTVEVMHDALLMPGKGLTPIIMRKRRYSAGSIRIRSPLTAHRLEVDTKAGSCWTIFITGPSRRVWGFHCPKGWVPWDQFVDVEDKGQTGRGCGEMS